MIHRDIVLTVAGAATALAFGSLAAAAAMPGPASLDTGSGIVQVQAPPAAGAPPAAPAATTTAPAATTAPATATAPASAPTGGKKAKKTTSRQKELDASVESGTVPKRYQSSVPKQYHHLIPFAK